MVKYSFNADIRSVFQRLAVAHQGTPAPTAKTEGRLKAASVIPFRPGAQQPGLEIAHVALRRSRYEPRDAVT